MVTWRTPISMRDEIQGRVLATPDFVRTLMRGTLGARSRPLLGASRPIEASIS